MDKIFLDMTSYEKKSEVQNKAQEVFLEALNEFLSERFERVEKVGNSTLAITIGVANDDDGFAHDVCMEIKGTVKHWYDSYRKEKEIPAYDIDEAAELYKMDISSKKKKTKE